MPPRRNGTRGGKGERDGLLTSPHMWVAVFWVGWEQCEKWCGNVLACPVCCARGNRKRGPVCFVFCGRACEPFLFLLDLLRWALLLFLFLFPSLSRTLLDVLLLLLLPSRLSFGCHVFVVLFCFFAFDRLFCELHLSRFSLFHV